VSSREHIALNEDDFKLSVAVKNKPGQLHDAVSYFLAWFEIKWKFKGDVPSYLRSENKVSLASESFEGERYKVKKGEERVVQLCCQLSENFIQTGKPAEFHF
jgi:hypothetical protein